MVELSLTRISFCRNLQMVQQQEEGEEGEEEDEVAQEGPWLSEFPSMVVMTFVFWTAFAVTFASILYGKLRSTSNNSKSSSLLGSSQ